MIPFLFFHITNITWKRFGNVCFLSFNNLVTILKWTHWNKTKSILPIDVVIQLFWISTSIGYIQQTISKKLCIGLRLSFLYNSSHQILVQKLTGQKWPVPDNICWWYWLYCEMINTTELSASLISCKMFFLYCYKSIQTHIIIMIDLSKFKIN